MLQGRLQGHETKEGILKYLTNCDCPALKKLINK